MHSDHCDRIRQPQLGSDQALRTGNEGAMSRERLGVGRTSPRDGGGGHPAAATAEGLDGGPIQWGSRPRGLCAEEEEG